MTLATSQDAFVVVRAAICDALGTDESEITLESTLGPDLDAESIDTLDIFFRIDKQLDTRVTRHEFGLIDMDHKLRSDEPMRLDELRDWGEKFPFDRRVAEPISYSELFTVGFLCQCLCEKFKIEWHPDQVDVNAAPV